MTGRADRDYCRHMKRGLVRGSLPHPHDGSEASRSCVCSRVSSVDQACGTRLSTTAFARESSRRSLLVVAPRTQHALTPRPRLSFACGRLRARSAFLGTIAILVAPGHRRLGAHPRSRSSRLSRTGSRRTRRAGCSYSAEQPMRLGSFDGRGPAMIRGCLMGLPCPDARVAGDRDRPLLTRREPRPRASCSRWSDVLVDAEEVLRVVLVA